jgi:hypothetical protein
LKNALDFVREEDVFVVTKLDRLARSVVDLSLIVQRLEEKNVDLVVMDQGIDTTTIYGRLQFNILAAIGEFWPDPLYATQHCVNVMGCKGGRSCRKRSIVLKRLSPNCVKQTF